MSLPGDENPNPQWQRREEEKPRWTLSVIALILGFTAKNEIDRSGGQLGGSGIALAGIITGGLGATLYLLFFLAVVALG